MKMRRPHRIPLAPRAATLLRELHSITGNGRFVFPSNRSRQRCMSENTINAALRRLGFSKDEMTAHGFRSAASSILNECGMWNADAIERQLAHVDNDSVRRAYARADFWEERVRIMDWWAERCRERRGRSPARGMTLKLLRQRGTSSHSRFFEVGFGCTHTCSNLVPRRGNKIDGKVSGSAVEPLTKRCCRRNS
jgi:Phage integrase family